MYAKALVVLLVGVSIHTRPATACSQMACPQLQASPRPVGAEARLGAKDADVLAKAAFTIATHGTAQQLAALGTALRKPGVAARITSPCALAQILRALADNPAARDVFTSLLDAPAWAVRDVPNGSALSDTLLIATGGLRPASPELVAFWTRFAQPGRHTDIIAMALTDNGTAEAAALFEQLIRDDQEELEVRMSWLRHELVGARQHVELLRAATRLLDSKLPAPLLAALAEGVFDYRQEWFGTCRGPDAAALATYSVEARHELRTIAAKVRARKPDAALAAAITKTLAALDALPSP